MQQSRSSAGRVRSRTTRPHFSASTAAKFSRPRRATTLRSSALCRASISTSACLSTSSTGSAASCIPIALPVPASDEKEWSLADTALLNDAYRTLEDPIRRTEYLLKLQGAEIGEEHSGKDRPKNEMGTRAFRPTCSKKSST